MNADEIKADIRMLQEHAATAGIPLPIVPESNDPELLAVYADELRDILNGGAK